MVILFLFLFTTKNHNLYYIVMVVIDLSGTYNILIIPRTLNVDNAHTFSLTDEDTRIASSISNTKVINNGYIDYSVSIANTAEGNSYSLKITDDTTTEVVWRGKVFATAQTTQNYVINE